MDPPNSLEPAGRTELTAQGSREVFAATPSVSVAFSSGQIAPSVVAKLRTGCPVAVPVVKTPGSIAVPAAGSALSASGKSTVRSALATSSEVGTPGVLRRPAATLRLFVRSESSLKESNAKPAGNPAGREGIVELGAATAIFSTGLSVTGTGATCITSPAFPESCAILLPVEAGSCFALLRGRVKLVK